MAEDNKKELSGESSEIIVPQGGAVVKSTTDVDGFLEKRKEFIEKVSAICVEGADFHVIKNKKSLAKGGAEKIASIFQWNSSFEKDTDALEMFGNPVGLVAFKCTLRKGMKFVGEGRGAASLDKNDKDPNKTLKMAQKSAFIDAVLRASGLSDFFTQDLEDMPQADIGTNKPLNKPTQVKPSFEAATDKQIATIKSLREEKGYTRDEVMVGVDFKAGDSFGKAAASKFIEWLMAQPKKVTAEVVNDWPPVGKPDHD